MMLSRLAGIRTVGLETLSCLSTGIKGSVMPSSMQPSVLQSVKSLNTSVVVANNKDLITYNNWTFMDQNKIKYAPQLPGEKPRHAFVCHRKDNIKGSTKKMFYLVYMIRGMKVEQAITHLSLLHKGQAIYVIDTIKEAVELAVNEHNVEYASNLWVSEAFTERGLCLKGLRMHSKRRPAMLEYKYSNLFIKLEEGEPPEQYHWHKRVIPAEEKLENYLKSLRERKIYYGL